jgi:ribosomal protein S14
MRTYDEEPEPHIDSPRRPPLREGDRCAACDRPAELIDALGYPLCRRCDREAEC